MSGTRSLAPKGPATEALWRDSALVLAAHGIRGEAGVADEHARAIQARGLFAEVRACAHKGRPDLIATLQDLAARACFLVPLLMSEAYTLKNIVRRIERAPGIGPGVRICRPIGVHPDLSRLIAAKAEATCEALNWRIAETALMIAGHGTRRDPNSGATARAHAGVIAAGGGFAEVVTGFLDEPPGIGEALAAVQARQCVVVGMFVDRGEHGEEDIPELLAQARARAAYAGPIGTDPMLVGLILDQVRAAVKLEAAA